MPQVTVIIPTYNRAAMLVEAVESVLAQSYRDYEVIVADDGSIDDTAQRIGNLGREVRYLPLEHSGRPSVVRNRALALARGELIAFLDDDDRWQPDKLERQVALFQGDHAPDFVFSDVCFFSDDSVSKPVLATWQKTDGYIFDNLLRDCYIYPSTVVVRRKLLKAVGEFDETFAIVEDYDLWLRLAHSALAGFVDAPLVWVRRHPHGISQLRNEDIARNVVRSLEQLPDQFTLSPAQQLSLRRILARRYTHLGMTLQADGDTKAGRQQYLHALRLNPMLLRAWLQLLRDFSVSLLRS